MRILFIGGTRFVGRAMAEAALQRDHAVTLLHRGQTDSPVLTAAEHLRADRDKDLSVLAGRAFDATIDVCAYVPRQVRALADALNGRGGHHVFVSTMSVYADTDAPGLTESAPFIELDDPATEEVTGDTYGGLKVLCERQAQVSYGDDGLTIVRPTYVIGPHDHTGRFTWWVRRIARGGEVLAPAPYDAPIQIIDARDLAEWTLDLAEERVSGAYNAISPGAAVRVRRPARRRCAGRRAVRHPTQLGRAALADRPGRDIPVAAAVDRGSARVDVGR